MMDGFDGNKITKLKVPAELELRDDSTLFGYVFVSPQARVSDLLNDSRAFIPVERMDGSVEIIAKTAIFRVVPMDQKKQESAGNDPYAILGISQDATDEEIKAAYHRIGLENHPDKISGLGLAVDFVELANIRMARINDAYQRIRKKRGLVEAA